MYSSKNATTIRCTTNLVTRLLLTILTITMLAGTAGQARATGLMFYGLEDGQVRSLDMATGGDSGISIPAAAFVGAPPSPATGRNIAYDPATDLLWYSAADNHVRSVEVSTLTAGPTISDINDAIYGAIRTIAIDHVLRRLYISNSNGNVEVYDLITNTKKFTIPLSAFGFSEPNPGNRRRLAADANANLWYAADDGTFKEFNPFQHNPHFTGREIPVSEQIEPVNPRQDRCFVAMRKPNGQHYLYYASSDGTVRTANLDTLTNAATSFPAFWFLTWSSPGALRSLSIDPTWSPPGTPPAMPTGITATDGTYPDLVEVTWSPVTNVDYYYVYRRVYGTNPWGQISLPLMGPPFYNMNFIVPGEIYEYAVKAYNQWGHSELSTDTDTGYAGAMAPPTGLTASQGTFDDRVRLTWNAVSGATGYLIGIGPYSGGFPYSVWVQGTTYDHMDALPAGSLWEYWVYACTDLSSCSSSTASVWGWIGIGDFADGFESGDTSEWSSVHP